MKIFTQTLLLLFAAGVSVFPAVDIEPVLSLIDDRCLDCHDAETRKGGIDLEQLSSESTLADSKIQTLWLRVDRVVRMGEMPPAKKKPLTAEQRALVQGWFRDNYILRNGAEHIGATPLRRLSRYELINTLEDLLHVSLKRPYVFSSEFPALLDSTLESVLPPDVPGESGFFNDADQLASGKLPVLRLTQAYDYALQSFVQSAEARERVFGFANEPKELSQARAGEILQRFTLRAFRGYRNEANEQLVQQAYLAKRRESPPVESLLHAMKMALVSPAFLYRMELARDSEIPCAVSGEELAVRLSYFLWGSMPDEELFRLAKRGELDDDEVLLGQVQRMLQSPKRIALSENFAGQWLGFRELWHNKAFYRNEAWNRGVYDELLFFFDELVKSDRSVLELIDSDWVYQSNYTGVSTPGKGHAFENRHDDILAVRRKRPPGIQERFYDPPRLLKVNSEQRGGVITTVGIMRLTSPPEKTNPIRRGVWMLDKIIGRKMHAPENIPALSQSETVNGKKLDDLADILKAHTSKAVCVSCHKHIDPIGLGLEQFGPYGKWREQYGNKRPVKARGEFPNGGTFTTPKEMKRVLFDEYRAEIIRNIARQMFAYALGRKLEPHDRPAVDRICEELKSNGYKMNTLIEQIVLSKQFRLRQDEP